MKNILYEKRIISLCFSLCCLLVATLSCEKQLPSVVAEGKFQRLSDYDRHYGIFSAIPVDITEYNLLLGTKTDGICDSSKFCLDSVLMWHEEQQLYFHKEDMLYRQIPLQMSGKEIYCKIADKLYKGKTTRVDSYCIIVESMQAGELYKYLVTMFPEYTEDGFNEKCTYIEKGNYSGIIIFSTPDGTFQKIEHYHNGLVLPGVIFTAEELAATEKEEVKYVTLYRKSARSDFYPRTKSLDDTLDSIVVIGTKPEDTETEKKGDDEDGGGGSTLPPTDGSGYEGEGGSGNSSNPEEPVYYTVSVAVNGNGTASGGGTYTANTNVMLTASCNEETTFGGWVNSFEIESMDKAYTFEIISNCSYTAYFHGIDTECGRLAQKYKGNKDLNRGFILLDSVRAPNNEIEHGVYKTDNITNGYIEGASKSIVIPWDKGVYEYFIHSHPSDALIPSIDDIYGMYLSYKNGAFNSETVLFLQTYLGCLGFEIENIALLEDFFKTEVFKDSIMSDEDQMEIFKKKFQDKVLGNPSENQLKDDEFCRKAIGYYLNSGVKIAKAEKDNNGNNISWAYAQQGDTTITYKDCIQIN